MTVSPVCNWKANDINDDLCTEAVMADGRRLQIICSSVPESMQISSVLNATMQSKTTDQTVMSTALAVDVGIP